jgi:two-component system chemotaxis response regulator CheY
MSQNPRMLVIDDFVTMTRVMRTLAQRIGFEEVDVCHDGETALGMLRARDYGFVLCDLEMNPMSGVEFARRARAQPWGSRCVILLTTASRESAARAVRDGAHPCTTFPIPTAIEPQRAMRVERAFLDIRTFCGSANGVRPST